MCISLYLALERRQTSAHDLIDEQKIAGNDRGRVNDLSFHSIVVDDAVLERIESTAGLQVDADEFLATSRVRVVQLDEHRLLVVASVLRQRLGYDEHGVGERGHTETRLAFHRLFVRMQRIAHGQLERASAWHDELVLDGVGHCSQAVLDGVLDLRHCVLVRRLDQHGHRFRVLAALHERVLVLTLQRLISSLFLINLSYFGSLEN